MRNVITLNKNKQEAGKTSEQASAQNAFTTKHAGQPVIQIRQTKHNRQHQSYSEQEHETVPFQKWSMQLAEEDMNDPDLAVDFSGNRGYMLQPG